MPPELLAGPYRAPFARRGDWLDDEIDGRVQVGGYSAGRIEWPRRLKTGKPSLILCGDLVRAVLTESAEAIQHWFGVGSVTVWKWRKALGVDRQNNEGTQALYKALQPIKLPERVAARGRRNALTPEAIAKQREAKAGKPVPQHVRDTLLRAAKAPKPEGWGKRANAWMQAAKKRA